GHVPLYRKLPRRGFNNHNFRTEFDVVNVSQLEKIQGDVADRETLVAAGLVRASAKHIKVLGTGDITRAIQVTADKFSATAKEKIEKAGGSVTVLMPANDASE
ncbi:MAG: 50S ribosomal protein L15, partial [Verrucomicrobia bacterium]|nr:50S ribosomal protein L15 [Verrucomicrobiota bacterium]